MTVAEALGVAFAPHDANRPRLVEALDVLARALDQTQAHALEQDRIRMLAGTPYAPLLGWSNTVRGVS